MCLCKYKYVSIYLYITLLKIRVQRIKFIGYRSLTYHNNLPCTLNGVHDF